MLSESVVGASTKADQPGNGRLSAASGLLRSFQVLPVVSVTAKAESKTALFVRVTPRLTGSKHWSFKVRVKKRETWRATSRTSKTQGKRQTRTLNLKNGTYRAAVKPDFSYAGSTSRAVTSKRCLRPASASRQPAGARRLTVQF